MLILFFVAIGLTPSLYAAEPISEEQASSLVAEARAFLDQGKPDRALEILRRPELSFDARANYWRGAILKKQGNLEQAAEALQAALRLVPGLIEGRLLLAEVFKEQGRLKESIEQYEISERFLVNSPFLPNVRSELAGLYTDIARQMKNELPARPELAGQAVDLAKRMFRQELFSEAEQLLEAVIVNSKDNAQAYYWLGQAYLRRGRKNDGVGALEQSVELAPDNLVLKIELAKVYEDVGRFDRAESIYRKVVAADQVTPAQRALAESRLRVVDARRLALAGDDARALERYRQLLLESPDDPRLLELTAQVLEKLGRRDEADRIYLRLRQLLPTDAEFRLRLAEVYRLRGDIISMQAAYAEAMRIATDEDIRRRALDEMGLKRGDNLILLGEYEKAKKVIDNLAKLVPENPEVLMRLARIALDQERYDEAEEVLKHILSIRPDHVYALLSLGRLYQSVDRYGEAIRTLEKVVRLDSAKTATKTALELLKPLYEKQAAVVLESLAAEAEITAALQKRALDLGRRLFGRGQIKEAESVLTALLQKAPDDAQANYWLGKLEIKSKRVDAGLAHMATSVALAPENNRLKMELGKAYESVGRWQEAAAEYARIVESAADEKIRREARKRQGIAQGQQLMAAGKKEEALAVYDRLLAEFPADSQLLGLQGAVLQDLGRAAEADAAFDKLLAGSPRNIRIRLRLAALYEKQERFEKAADIYNQLLKIQPRNARIVYALGSLYLRMERFNDAYQKYVQAAALAPPASKILAQSKASLDLVKKKMIDRGRKHLEADELDEAEELFQGVLELDPDQARAHYWLSQLYKKRESFSDEVAALERSLALVPDNPPLIPVLAQAYLNAGLPAKAVKVLLPLVENSPFDFESRLILAESYEKLGQRLLADQQLEWILQHDPDDGVRKKTLDRLGLQDGLDSMKNGDHEAARKVFARILAIVPEDPVINKYMAESLLKEGETASALVFLQTAMSATPDDPVLHQQLARVYESLEKFDESLAEYRLLTSMNLSAREKKRAQQGLNRLLKRRATGLLDELELGDLDEAQRASLQAEVDQMIQDGAYAAARMIAEALIDEMPGELWGYELLARAYQENEQYDDAILLLKKALALHPGNPELLLKLARAFRLADKPGLALATYRELLFSQPDSAVAPLEMAEIFRQQGDEEAMRSSLILALRQGDDPVLRRRALDELGLQDGMAALANDDIDRAREVLQALQALAPDEPDVLLLQAGIARQSGALDEATGLFRRILASHGERQDVRLRLAEVLVEQGHREEAIPVLEKVASLGPANRYARKAAGILRRLSVEEGEAVLQSLQAADVIDEEMLQQAVTVGRHLYRRKQLKGAEAIFITLLKKQVADAQVYFWLAKIKLDKKRLQEGIGLLKKSIALAPDNLRLQMTLAKTYEGAGRWQEAEAAYRRIVDEAGQKSGEIAEARKRLQIVRAQLFVKQGKPRQAMAIYDQILRQTPDDVQVLGLKGVLLIGQKRLAEADAIFGRLIELAPDNARIRLRLAGIYRQQGRQQDAEEQLLSLLERHPSGPLARQALQLLGLKEMGKLRKGKDWQGIEALLKQMLEKVPDNMMLLKLLADNYRQQGRLPEFQRTLQRILRHNPEDAGTLWGLAQLYLSTRREAKAVPLLERLAEKERQSQRGQQALQILSDYYRRQVNKYRKSKEYTKAAGVLEKFVRDNPDNIQARLQLGLYYYYGRELDKARDVFAEVTRLAPTEATAYHQLALIYARQKKPRKEIENHARFISLAEDEKKADQAATDLLLALVTALLEEGRQVAAIRVLEQMRDRGVKDTRVYSMLGYIQTQQGERELAIEAYRQGIAIDENNLFLRINLALLYEQTSADMAALAQYRAILKRGKPGNRYVESARQRKKGVEARLRRFTSNLSYSVRGGQSVIEEQDVSNTGAINTSFSSSLNYSLSTSFHPTKTSNIAVSASVAHSANHSSQNDSIAPSLNISGNLNLGSGFLNSSASYRETFGLLLDTFAGYGVNASVGGGIRFAHPVDALIGLFTNSDDSLPDAVLWTERPLQEASSIQKMGLARRVVLDLDAERLRESLAAVADDVDVVISAIFRARLALQQGHPQTVLDELSRLHERLPSNPEINLLLGLAYQELGQDDLALSSYWQVLDKHHDNPQARYFYGEVLLNQGYAEEAAGWFAGVLDAPDAASVLKAQARQRLVAIHQARVAELLARDAEKLKAEQVLAELDTLEDVVPPAVMLRNIDGFLEKFPDSPDLLLRKGQVRLRLQRPDQAINSLERADDLREDDLTIERVLAEAYIRAGRLEDGLGVYRRMLRHSQDARQRYRLHRRLPVFEDLDDLSDYDPADEEDLAGIVKDLEQLAAPDMGDVASLDHWLTMADEVFRQGAAAAARAAYRTLIERSSPADALLELRIAETLLADRQREKAVAIVQALIDRDDSPLVYYRALQLLGFFQAIEDLFDGDYEDALVTLTAIQQVLPEDPLVLLNMGISERRLKEDLKAKAFFEVVLENEPDNLTARWLLGLFYSDKKQLNRGMDQLEEVVADGRGTLAAEEAGHRLQLLEEKRFRALMGEVDQKADTATKVLSLSLGYNNFTPIRISLAETQAYSLNSSLRLPSTKWGTATLSYGLTKTINEDPRGTDYANTAQQFSLAYGRPIPGIAKLSGNLSFSRRIADYDYFDSNARVDLGILAKRQIIQDSFSAGLSYQLHPSLTLSANYSQSRSQSNLPVGLVYRADDTPIAFQSLGLGDLSSKSLNLSVRFRF